MCLIIMTCTLKPLSMNRRNLKTHTYSYLNIIAFISIALTTNASAQEGIPSIPPWQTSSPWPDRIIVTVSGDPATSFSVTWRTDNSVVNTRAEIVEADAAARFDLNAMSVQANTEQIDLSTKMVGEVQYPLRWNTDLGSSSYHSVSFTNLEPDKLYAYRVMGAEAHWSEWFQTRTAPVDPETLKFLYFGDAQNGILSHWARVVRSAYSKAPDARFAIHAGDLVNYASRDFEWAEWFQSVSFIHGMIPALPVVGNHEYFDGIVDADRRFVTSLSKLWRPQFTLPVDPGLPAAVQETVYSIDYGNVIIVVLDTMAMDQFEIQAEWMDRIFSGSSAKWKIVTMHHPVFELVTRNYPGLIETGPERRKLFLPVLAKHRVDLALQGHDHSYGRGAITVNTGTGSNRQNVETVFVTSSASPKSYNIQEGGWDSFRNYNVVLQRQAENTQFFQVVEIEGNSLLFQAFTATGELYDAFRLNKVDGRANELIKIDTEVTKTRSYSNTLPYEDGRYDTIPPVPSGMKQK